MQRRTVASSLPTTTADQTEGKEYNPKKKVSQPRAVELVVLVSFAIFVILVAFVAVVNSSLSFSSLDRRYADATILRRPRHYLQPSDLRCEEIRLSRPLLDRSLALGARFLMDHQKKEGNFDYEYDWKTGVNTQDDSEVRQAGALWGLTLIFHDMMDHYAENPNDDGKEVIQETAQRILRGIDFFRINSKVLTNKDDDDANFQMRYIWYPDGNAKHSQGTQGLVCLAIIDFLRGLGDDSASAAGVTEREKEYTQALLNELLPFLVTQHTGLVDKDSNRFSGWNELRGAGKQVIDSGLWHGKAHENSMIRWWQQWVSKGGTFYSRFDIDGHREGIRPSPYYDGESLLAITKAAKYLGPDYVHLWPIAAGTARSLHQVHVVESLEEDPDSDDTKGVYQWLSMALFELATVTFGDGRGYDLPSSIEETYNAPQLGAWLVKMALWMVDVHKTLQKSLNTGYAYEGIVPAWAWASQDANREDTARKLHCAIEKGLGRLIMWQVGMGEVEKGGEDDEVGEWDGVSGLGGVQNAEKESGLRIDVTQHQMHATILARRLVYPQKGATWPWETTKISKAMARKRRV